MAAQPLHTPVFDADTHRYETHDSLTELLADRYRGMIDDVDVRGRIKIAGGNLARHTQADDAVLWR